MIYPDIQENAGSVYLSPNTYTAFLPGCREKYSYTEKQLKYISSAESYTCWQTSPEQMLKKSDDIEDLIDLDFVS